MPLMRHLLLCRALDRKGRSVSRGTTVPANRRISAREADLVTWLLRNASVAGDLSVLEPSVGGLRVVARCSCGCPSVDFEPDGQSTGASPIADALGETASGVSVGVILWGRPGVITGLELCERDRPVRDLPERSTLHAWDSA
jgi:hypothetical protein